MYPNTKENVVEAFKLGQNQGDSDALMKFRTISSGVDKDRRIWNLKFEMFAERMNEWVLKKINEFLVYSKCDVIWGVWRKKLNSNRSEEIDDLKTTWLSGPESTGPFVGYRANMVSCTLPYLLQYFPNFGMVVHFGISRYCFPFIRHLKLEQRLRIPNRSKKCQFVSIS